MSNHTIKSAVRSPVDVAAASRAEASTEARLPPVPKDVAEAAKKYNLGNPVDYQEYGDSETFLFDRGHVSKAAGVGIDSIGTEYKHTVQSGENLSKIATRYGLTDENGRPSVKWLAEMNGIKDPNLIKVGQKLDVSMAGHVVMKGETLSRIADSYGTTVAALATANNIKDPNRILAGSVLAVPEIGC
jgi:LysM repeat protein